MASLATPVWSASVSRRCWTKVMGWSCPFCVAAKLSQAREEEIWKASLASGSVPVLRTVKRAWAAICDCAGVEVQVEIVGGEGEGVADRVGDGGFGIGVGWVWVWLPAGWEEENAGSGVGGVAGVSGGAASSGVRSVS